MPVAIVKYTPAHVDQVVAFNSRLLQNGYRDFALPADPANLGKGFEGWLALDRDLVRGGYFLKHEMFSFSGDLLPVAFYNLSLSEAVIDRAFAGVSIKLVLSALEKQPRLYALGMGGLDRPLPKFLRAMGWDLALVPFFFCAVRPARVLRNVSTLRHPPWRRALADLASATGIATLGIGGLHAILRLTGGRTGGPTVEVVPEFEAWADQLWDASRQTFAMIGLRTAAALNDLYPPSLERISRLKISRGGAVIGWAVVRDTPMRGHTQFGDLRVGTIVDCLAEPSSERSVAAAAAAFLKRQGVDLIISNQSHQLWTAALKSIGFIEGPSNYALATSKSLSALIGPLKASMKTIHVTRGDGDGPIHL